MRLRAADGRPAPDDLEVSWVPDQEDPEESELLEPDVIDQEEVCPICGYPYPCHWERGGLGGHPVLGLQRHHLLLIGIAVLLGLVVALVLIQPTTGAPTG